MTPPAAYTSTWCDMGIRSIKMHSPTLAVASAIGVPKNQHRVGLYVSPLSGANVASIAFGEPAVLARGFSLGAGVNILHLTKEEIGDAIMADIHVVGTAAVPLAITEVIETPDK